MGVLFLYPFFVNNLKGVTFKLPLTLLNQSKIRYHKQIASYKMKHMRLSPPEIKVLLDTINQIDADAQVRLFGSRIDDEKKGGDIDLLILSQKTEVFTRQALRQIRQVFFDAFGEQKIDIVVDSLPPKVPFVKTIISTSLPINNTALDQFK